jgi:hypothetical protein
MFDNPNRFFILAGLKDGVQTNFAVLQAPTPTEAANKLGLVCALDENGFPLFGEDLSAAAEAVLQSRWEIDLKVQPLDRGFRATGKKEAVIQEFAESGKLYLLSLPHVE